LFDLFGLLVHLTADDSARGTTDYRAYYSAHSRVIARNLANHTSGYCAARSTYHSASFGIACILVCRTTT
jgi:hypothetical protein